MTIADIIGFAYCGILIIALIIVSYYLANRKYYLERKKGKLKEKIKKINRKLVEYDTSN